MTTEVIYSIFLSLILNGIILIFFENIKNKIDIYDIPDSKRKLHKTKIPLFGGLFVFANLVFCFYLPIIFLGSPESFYVINAYEIRQAIFFLFITTCIFLIGLYDDKFNLSFDKRLLYLFLIIILFCNYNPQFKLNFLEVKIFNLYLDINTVSPLFITLSIITFIIACNLFDGINIQSPLYFIYILIILIYLNILEEFNIFLLIPLSFILYLNYKQKIFFGDSGIYLVSFLISYSFVFGYKNNLISSEQILLLIAVQIYDSIRVIFRRILSGINPTNPDKIHIHHILLNKYKLNKVVIIISSIYILPSFIHFFLDFNVLYSLIIQFILYLSVIFLGAHERK